MKISQQFDSVLSFIKRPYPEAESMSKYIRTMFIISIFVFLFLGIIKPFKIDQNQSSVWIHSLLFGCITFIIGVAYEVFLRYVLRINKTGDKYTFSSWIFQVIGLLLTIAFFNYLYAAYEFGMPWKVLPNMILATFLVGIFPTVFIGTTSMIKSEARNADIAKSLSGKSIEFKSPSEVSSIFDLPINKILFIESLQNYVNLYHNIEGALNKKTERATLKSCENQISNTTLLRCHRSFIVNTSMIESVKGNAQGLKLKLYGLEREIPVSRSYIPLFKT